MGLVQRIVGSVVNYITINTALEGEDEFRCKAGMCDRLLHKLQRSGEIMSWNTFMLTVNSKEYFYRIY